MVSAFTRKETGERADLVKIDRKRFARGRAGRGTGRTADLFARISIGGRPSVLDTQVVVLSLRLW